LNFIHSYFLKSFILTIVGLSTEDNLKSISYQF